MILIFSYLKNAETVLRESSFNMTRGGGGDEDIEGGSAKIFGQPKGGL